MTDSTLFADQSGTTTPQIDPDKDYYAELVGEGKKFTDNNELAKGKVAADAFIEQLKAELAGLRTELNTKLSMEQYLDKMTDTGANRNAEALNEPNGANGGNDTSTLKPEDIERIIDQRVSQREAERIQNENLRTVKETLSQSLGPDFAPKLKSIGESLGMTEDEMNSLARTKPKAFLALVNPGASQREERQTNLFSPPTGSNPRSEKMNTERTFSYYENLRKTDAKTYWTPAIQNQMHKDAQRLQENFFD